MGEEKKNNLIKKVDAISKTLGFEGRNKTIFEIKKTDDPKVKELHLRSGTYKSEDPWFAIDEDESKTAYAIIPTDSFSQMLKILKDTQKENFDLKLEKTIWQNIPTDFEDVWVVAMDEIQHLAQQEPNKPVSIDLDNLVKDIKDKHPNLFVNLKDYFPPQLQNQQGLN